MSRPLAPRRRPGHPRNEPEHKETPEMMFTSATLDRFPEELDLDVRTIEEMAEDDATLTELARETVYGLSARPGVTR